MRLIVLATAALLAPTASGAQLQAGTLLEDGRVVVKIYVTMPDPVTAAGHPIPNVSLVLSGPNSRFSLTTDGAGTATGYVRPGAYRVATLDPVEWRGTRYRWDVPLTVRPGIGVLDLTPSNGAVVERTTGQQERAPSGAAAEPASRSGSGFGPKDPGTARLLSVLVTGGGQIYAGETGKGISMMLLGGILSGAGFSFLGCDDDCSDDSAIAAAFFAGAIGVWAYGIADADDAARRWNARNAVSTRLTPVIVVGGERTRLGASFRF